MTMQSVFPLAAAMTDMAPGDRGTVLRVAPEAADGTLGERGTVLPLAPEPADRVLGERGAILRVAPDAMEGTPGGRSNEDAGVGAGAVSDELAAILERLSGRPVAAIGAASDLSLDLGLDSLGRVELATLVAEELGVDLDDAAVAAANTVGDLEALLAAARAGSPGAEGRQAEARASFPRWGRAAPARLGRAALQGGLLFPLVDAVCQPLRIEGAEHLCNVQGPVLLVANHTSHLDTPVLLRALPAGLRRRMAVAAAADYWYAGRAPAALATLLLGGFPFAREGAIRPSLDYCGELTRAGWSVLVYPEGTRAPDGRLQRFKPGVGRLAAELGVPVVPVGLVGLHAVLPKGERRPRQGPVAVRFGPLLRFAPDTPPAAVAARLEAAVAGLAAAPPSPA